ncbi:TonB-dependent receptor plug domain-containing protein [Sphingomonas nostoxanthinifaciens]|uniref:TonB-dependent receptor plug domain-containing protein n=1 Tax=Sphingomonas nostoxanthinifaciens TaxID=2872652 RepID=UPI00295308B9|nr:TonB-dependent receptor [Sphingomonas nostoxanthinifaciens]UAK23119.1 TonB-dependent receptor [Sphingomonas nostoxanthinifaciens]
MSNRHLLVATLMGGTALCAAMPVQAQQAAPAQAQTNPSSSDTGAGAQGPQTSATPAASAADAQSIGGATPPAAPEATQEIVVTGSSIRGVAPTGSALTTVSRADIVATGASTTTELLRSVPQLGSFGATGGNTGHDQANFVDQPAIHGIGVGNGGGGLTLVLVDGMRLPGAGINQTAPDPSAIPPSAIERVEVVADGASSIYGSDAVAGVVNFILRKNVNGIETNGKIGFGEGYRTYNASILAGKTWSSGSILFDYEFSKNSNVNGRERDYYHMNTPSTLCNPANVTVGGVNYALSGNSATRGATNTCDVNKANDLFPAQHRHQGMISLRQELTDGITLHARTIYSRRDVDSLQAISGGYVASGGLSVPVTSGQFYNYVLGLGVPAGAQSVTYNPTGDFGPTVTNRIRTETWSSNVGIDANLFADWKGSIDANYGRERDNIYQPGINQTLLTSLVASGQFNPYGVGPANSSTLVSQIGDYRTHYYGQQTVLEGLAKVDGTVFNLPGGAVKAALGTDVRRERFAATVDVGPSGTQPQTSTVGTRKSYSFYGELFIPVFGADNAMPGFQKLDLSLSGRYDHYNDVGGTTNPKVGVNWTPVESLTFHGSFGKSFHAPSLADAGTAIDTRVIRFSDFTGAGSSAYSIILAGGNKLQPEKATTWSLGGDFKPIFAPGVKLSASYFNIDYKNVITFPGFDVVTQPNNPIYDRYRTYAPTAAEVLAATAGLRHDGISYPDVTQLPTAIYDLRRQNFAEQKIDGIDFDASYAFTRDFGSFNIGAAGTWLWKFDQKINGDTVVTSRLNTNYAVNFKARAHFGWAKDRYDATVFVNYTNHYRNLIDGSQTSSNTTVDFHGGWRLPLSGIGDNTQLTVDVTNLFDKKPPYYYDAGNNYYGFDPTTASALGRVVSIGIRKKF